MDVDDVYDPEEEQERLAAVIEPWYERMLAGLHELVASAFVAELTPDEFRLDDEATRMILEEAAERVVRIDETTREAVREQLKEGQARGYSAWQIANGVPAEGFRGIDGLFVETWRSRAETIARSELAQASMVSALNRYAATGLVDRVKIHENTDTDAPCAARAGLIVPLSSRPLPLHPNCQMGLEPIPAATVVEVAA